MRYTGLLSARQAAARCRVNEKTMCNWARRALDEDDARPARLRGVQQTATGMYLIPLSEVERLKPRAGQK